MHSEPIRPEVPVSEPSSDPAMDVSAEASDVRRDAKTQDILARLKSVEGHVRGVSRMVQEDADCMDLVHQLRGVQRALAKVNGLILDRHLHSCATAALRGDDPDDRERVIQELLDAFAAADRG